MTDLVVGAHVAAIALLCAAGWTKVRRPEQVGPVLDVLGIVRGAHAVGAARAIGGAEIAVALAAVAAPSRPTAAAVALAYTALAVVALRIRMLGRRDRARRVGCGCLGRVDAPVTLAHVALDVAAAVACAMTAVRDPRPVTALAGTPVRSAWLVALALVAAWAAALVVTELPRLRPAALEADRP